MATRACPQCGNSLPERAKFCGQCGSVSEVGPATDPAPPPAAIDRRNVTATIPDAPRASSPLASTAVAPDRARTMIEFAADPPIAPPVVAAPKPNPLASTVVMNDAPNPLAQTLVTNDASNPLASTLVTNDSPHPLASTLVTNDPPTHVVDAVASSPAPVAPLAQPPSAIPAPVASTPRLATDKRTMIGMSAADVFGPGGPPPAPVAAPPAASEPRFAKNTMMGVAMPGIAPIQPGVAKDAPAPMSLPSKSNTMLGVAMPGIAPIKPGPGQAPQQAPPRSRAPVPPPVEIVPAPAPLMSQEVAPMAPVVARKGGIPVAVVAIILGVLLVAGGLTIALLWKSAPPLSASPELDADGKETLHLRCEACADGTKATFNGMTATFAAHEAMLALKLPLHVGTNPIELKVERPGMGRDETVKLAVPVQFLIHADLGAVDGAHPAINVRVEAVAGSDVRVDDKPLALDASGVGVYAIDLTADADGASEERRVRKEIPYAVTPKGGVLQKGKVTAEVTVLPLRVDTPGLHAIVDTPSFIVAGRVYKASTVTVNGQPATVNADGFFEATVASASAGDVAVEVRTSSPTFVPRTVRFSVKRVDKLDAEAKAVEATSPAGYDAVAADLANRLGQPFIVDGEIVASNIDTKVHRTLAVVDDHRGCAKGPCIVRVVLGHEEKLAVGDGMRAYGRVARAVTTSDGKTVPEIEADFVLRGRGKR